MVKCEARIVRTFKRAKADVIWPWTVYGENAEAYMYEECGGDVTFTVEAVDEPYFGGTSPKLEIVATCTRCKAPYFPGVLELSTPEQILAAGLSDWIESKQRDR